MPRLEMPKSPDDRLSRRRFLALTGAGVAVAAGCGEDGPVATSTDGDDGGTDLMDAPGPTDDGATGLAVDSEIAGAEIDAELDGGPDVEPDAEVITDAEAPGLKFDPDAYAKRLDLWPLAVQSGDPMPDGALLWTRYDGVEALEIAVFADVPPFTLAFTGPATAAEGGFVHRVATGLTAATTYQFAFTANDKRSPIGRFRTAPEPDALPVVTFGGGSCAKLDYGPFHVLSHAADADLDFFLKAGDTVYADADDAESLAEYRSAWHDTFATAEYRALHTSTASIATWDDHEVTNNWDPEDIDADQLIAARQAFFDHTPMARNTVDPNRIWRSIRYGKTLEVFVLDTRSERKPSTKDDADAQYIGPDQEDALLEALSASDAVFKLILNSVPVADYPPLFLSKKNRWEGYPSQRTRILNHIENDTEGVIWLSGDFHFGALSRVAPPGKPFHDQNEVLMGPIAHINPLLFQLELTGDTAQFPLLVGAYNTAHFTADPIARTLSVDFIGADGASLGTGVIAV